MFTCTQLLSAQTLTKSQLNLAQSKKLVKIRKAKKTRRRRDSERELFYDEFAHVLQNTEILTITFMQCAPETIKTIAKQMLRIKS